MEKPHNKWTVRAEISWTSTKAHTRWLTIQGGLGSDVEVSLERQSKAGGSWRCGIGALSGRKYNSMMDRLLLWTLHRNSFNTCQTSAATETSAILGRAKHLTNAFKDPSLCRVRSPCSPCSHEQQRRLLLSVSFHRWNNQAPDCSTSKPKTRTPSQVSTFRVLWQ